VNKAKIKNIMVRNRYIRKLYNTLYKDIRQCKLIKENGKRKIYPKVLQMPITTRCNSKCIMCNIPNMSNVGDMTSEELGKALKDSIFKEITSIGINGGEPFILNNLEEYVNQVINSLPKLNYINIISNGFLTDRILEKSQKIYEMCKKNDIMFELLFSLDGYGDIHNIVRGIPGAFNKVEKTVDSILKERHRYADEVGVACTVVKSNVDYLAELESYCKIKGYPIKYRLGIENQRIQSNMLTDQYSVLYDKKSRQTAKEFFYCKYIESKDMKYYSIYKFLADNTKRLLGCEWKEQGITMDSKGNLYYCAVESKSLGNIKDNKGERVFFNNNNLNYRNEIICNKCDKCIHDYTGEMFIGNKFVYYKDKIIDKYSLRIYKKLVRK
jgi:hypothetical protein